STRVEGPPVYAGGPNVRFAFACLFPLRRLRRRRDAGSAHAPSLLRRTAGRSLPSQATIRLDLSPHHDTGLAVQRSELIPSNALRRGRNDQLHPDSVRSLVKRGLGRLAQGVEARLLLPGGRLGEARQLEHDP